MPTYSLTIDGVSIPKSNCIMPAKYNDHLDEQLDMATVSVFGVTTEIFKPFCKVSISVTGAQRENEPTITRYYRLMEDRAEESPVGTGKYRHDLTLIEETKFLEGFLVESLCVTNAGGRNYERFYPALENVDCAFYDDPQNMPSNLVLTDNFKSPIPATSSVAFPSASFVYQNLTDITPSEMGYINLEAVVQYPDGTTETFSYTGNDSLAVPGSFTPKTGLNKITWTSTIQNGGYYLKYDTYIYGQPNYYPLKPWTYKEVIERALELCEPRIWNKTTGDYVVPPRFTFRYNDPNDAHEIDVFDNLAPEFTFTRCTLRELLQEIGGALNKEPRLDENDNVYFVDFGGKEMATFLSAKTNTVKPLNQYPYIKKTQSWELEQACTRLDAHVDNFVNQISVGDATVGQPYLDGAQSLRTDSAYIRVTENTAIFPSALPILKINAFRWVDRDGLAGTTWARYDITNFVLEKTVYDSQLSNYSTAYPVSKAYGVYYTQGEKNIGGLFFENTEWSGGIFANPAIVNILRAVTGNNSLLNGASAADYAKLCFELEYIPIYSARVQHGKQYTGDFLAFPRTIAHNQSANMVEAQYYGENIKGMAERLGNVEKAFTFQCRYASTIPQAGQKWDDDYFISDVAVEITNPCFKVTVGLTKNFNRMSKYIGANSYRRIYEVSERMVQERNTIYTDYLVIVPGDYPAPTNYGYDFLFLSDGFENVYNTFFVIYGLSHARTKVSAAIIQGETKNGNETLPEVILPVVASAFGNVMEFSWSYKDNFSAGQKIVYQQNDNITGYFTTEVQYCDYYGRLYYENISLMCMGDTVLADPDALPEYSADTSDTNYPIAKTVSNYPIVCRKDSREALSGTYAVEFVTTMKDIVIGSALASNNPLVAGFGAQRPPRLYILKKPLNKLSRYVDLSDDNVAWWTSIVNSPTVTGLVITLENQNGSAPYIQSGGFESTVSGAAWAIVTPKYNGTPYTVEDEDGNTETFTPHYGGELLVGQNITVNVGDTIARFKIVGTHDIFKFIEEQED